MRIADEGTAAYSAGRIFRALDAFSSSRPPTSNGVVTGRRPKKIGTGVEGVCVLKCRGLGSAKNLPESARVPCMGLTGFYS